MSQLIQLSDMEALELPEIIHVFTKSDRVGYQGQKFQVAQIEEFQQ